MLGGTEDIAMESFEVLSTESTGFQTCAVENGEATLINSTSFYNTSLLAGVEIIN